MVKWCCCYGEIYVFLQIVFITTAFLVQSVRTVFLHTADWLLARWHSHSPFVSLFFFRHQQLKNLMRILDKNWAKNSETKMNANIRYPLIALNPLRLSFWPITQTTNGCCKIYYEKKNVQISENVNNFIQTFQMMIRNNFFSIVEKISSGEKLLQINELRFYGLIIRLNNTTKILNLLHHPGILI